MDEYSLVTKLTFTVTYLYFTILLNGPTIERRVLRLEFRLCVCLSVYLTITPHAFTDLHEIRY